MRSSPYTLGKEVFNLVIHLGSYFVYNMVYNPMDRKYSHKKSKKRTLINSIIFS